MDPDERQIMVRADLTIVPNDRLPGIGSRILTGLMTALVLDLSARAEEQDLRHPGVEADIDLEVQLLWFTIGIDFLPGHRMTIHDDLDRYSPRIFDTCPLKMPIWFFIQATHRDGHARFILL